MVEVKKCVSLSAAVIGLFLSCESFIRSETAQTAPISNAEPAAGPAAAPEEDPQQDAAISQVARLIERGSPESLVDALQIISSENLARSEEGTELAYLATEIYSLL